LRRPAITYETLVKLNPASQDVSPDVQETLETDIKFSGYIGRQSRENQRVQNAEKVKLPLTVDYNAIQQLSLEAREKLSKFRPVDLAQAKRISGVNPSDVQIVQVLLSAGRLPMQHVST
jgi:tRNA uridine 5-carboxymethylaminomethyl modification enzyme